MRMFGAMLLAAIMVVSSVDARRGGGSFSSGRSSSFSRSSSSRSRSSSSSRRSRSSTIKKRNTSKPKAVVNKKKSSTIKKKNGTTVKNKANQTKPTKIVKPRAGSKAEKKLNKRMASTDKNAAAKYGTKKQATKAYRQKLASQNKYSSKTPPATRPSHIPQNVNVGGRSYNTSYGMFPGGGYGYGYYDPTGLFVALAVNQMIINDHHMRMAGYGHWNATGQPVVYTSTNPVYVIVGTICAFLLICGMIVLIVKVSD